MEACSVRVLLTWDLTPLLVPSCVPLYGNWDIHRKATSLKATKKLKRAGFNLFVVPGHSFDRNTQVIVILRYAKKYHLANQEAVSGWKGFITGRYELSEPVMTVTIPPEHNDFGVVFARNLIVIVMVNSSSTTLCPSSIFLAGFGEKLRRGGRGGRGGGRWEVGEIGDGLELEHSHASHCGEHAQVHIRFHIALWLKATLIGDCGLYADCPVQNLSHMDSSTTSDEVCVPPEENTQEPSRFTYREYSMEGSAIENGREAADVGGAGKSFTERPNMQMQNPKRQIITQLGDLVPPPLVEG
ncbi:hypothetical protein B0T20DRAFT_389639 [Sordaria brevicollis]|uniref:Uncharacterized protein n=1 Tax=Sordaria brevicollis TaxID=83679 RepID=A0AAE0UF09_SORBR|nr:hypothetical protein B0T20DRAFT_389639 [Sordaria brevicollis]